MLYKINVAPRKGGLYRQCDIDNNLSVQHSALIPSSAAIGGSMPPNVQSSFYIAFPFLDSDFTDIAVISIFYKNRQEKISKKLSPPTLFVGVGMLHCICIIQKIRRHRNERKRR